MLADLDVLSADGRVALHPRRDVIPSGLADPRLRLRVGDTLRPHDLGARLEQLDSTPPRAIRGRALDT